MTDIQAANLALNSIAVAPIATLGDDSKAARTVNMLLAPTKDMVLSEFPWSFSTRVEPLVQAPPAITPPPGYKFMFVYPASAIHIFRAYAADFPEVVWSVFESSGSNYIATNQAGLFVEYAVRISDLNIWRSDVAQCYVYRLAHEIAFALSMSLQTTTTLFEKYSGFIQIAKNSSTVEENRAPYQPINYIDVRF